MAVNMYVEIVEEKDVKNQLSLILDRIPRWRREKVLSYRNDIDRYLCAKSFMLLQEGLMRDYGVKRCWYGHLHSGGCAIAFEGEACGIRFQLVSADHLRFFPQKIF